MVIAGSKIEIQHLGFAKAAAAVEAMLPKRSWGNEHARFITCR
jgi:hypothetical protein